MDKHYDSENKIAEVKTYQDLNKKYLISLISEAVIFADQNDSHSILFDHRNCKLDISMVELFNAIADVKVHGLTTDFVAAIVYDLDPDKYQFSEEVINSRKNPECRFFDDYDQAKSWLVDNHK